jgi:malonyl-CoA O-methyltransferase
LIAPQNSLIIASFNRAASSYDESSQLQKKACHLLLQGLHARQLPPPLHILDAGCGTGYGALLLQSSYPASQLYAVDCAPAMLQLAQRAGLAGCVANIEALPFAAARFNLWWSSLVVQWCDVDQVLHEAVRVLQPGGMLALSTLGRNTFHELRTAFQTVDQFQHTLPFLDAPHIVSALEHQPLHSVSLEQHTITLYYPRLKDLLGAIKAVGANQVTTDRRTGLMSRRQWQALESAYEAYRTPEGLPLTYHLLLAYARVHIAA